jgi:hypothetical protein
MDSYGFIWIHMDLWVYHGISLNRFIKLPIWYHWRYRKVLLHQYMGIWGNIFAYPKRRHPEIIHNLSPWLRIETNDDLGVPHFKKPHRSYYILIQVIIDDMFPMISHKVP